MLDSVLVDLYGYGQPKPNISVCEILNRNRLKWLEINRFRCISVSVGFRFFKERVIEIFKTTLFQTIKQKPKHIKSHSELLKTTSSNLFTQITLKQNHRSLEKKNHSTKQNKHSLKCKKTSSIIWELEIYELERLNNLSEESLRKLLLPFCSVCVCVSNNRTDDSKEKDRKNWEKKLGKGAAELKKETEEFEWRKLLLPFCSVCVCVKQSHRWFQGKR